MGAQTLGAGCMDLKISLAFDSSCRILFYNFYFFVNPSSSLSILSVSAFILSQSIQLSDQIFSIKKFIKFKISFQPRIFTSHQIIFTMNEDPPLTTNNQMMKVVFHLAKYGQKTLKELGSYFLKGYLKMKKIKKRQKQSLREQRKKEFFEKKKRVPKKRDQENEEKLKKTKITSKNQKSQELVVPQKFTEDITQPPPKPLEPFLQFLKQKKNEFKAHTKHFQPKQTSRLIHNCWKQMSDEEKRPYALAYQKEKLEYEKKRYEYHRKFGNERRQKKDKTAEKNPKDFLDELDDI